MVEPIDLGDDGKAAFTVDEVINLLDIQIDAILDDPDLTIQQARLCVELLRKVPAWAPRIVEQFIGVKQGVMPFFRRPWNRRTSAEMEHHLLSYGKFEDEIKLEVDGSLHHIDVGPLTVGSMADDGNLLIMLPIHIRTMDGEEVTVRFDD